MQDSGEDIIERVDEIGEHLLDELDGDERLSDGVPEDQRNGDLDFIQMSGMAHGNQGESADDVLHAPVPDLDASRPVSFYEKGVADVDSSMAPGILEDEYDADEEIVPVPDSGQAVRELRDILGELKEATASDEAEERDAAADAAAPDDGSAQDAAPDEADTAESDIPAPSPSPEEIAFGEPELPPEAVADDKAFPDQFAGPDTAEAMADFVDAGAPALDEEVLQDFGGDTRPEPAPTSTDLLEAERLVQELQAQPRDAAPVARSVEPEDEEPLDEEPVTPLPGEDDEDAPRGLEPNDVVYNRPRARRGRRRSGLRATSRRRLARWVVVLLLLGALAVGAYRSYVWLDARMATPARLFNDAGEAAARGQYREASAAYLRFAATYPDHPLRPEAQFRAGYTLQLIPPDSGRQAQKAREEAVALLEQFITGNPDYRVAKLARAQVLAGILSCELGQYQRAVDLLADPELRLKDPGGVLPALRALATAQAKLGDYKAALDLYLQAAGERGNFSADADRRAAAGLYQILAQSAATDDARRNYQELALDELHKAQQTPGISPGLRQEIRVEIELLEKRLADASPAPALREPDTAQDEPSDAGEAGAEEAGAADTDAGEAGP
ncbi:MAG: hypothetical protein JXR94_24425 [Candidatus Hydrogenedentes bacterium]|nr:hypothetical protein [Candidatus Hydrogenedentota bacterium]